MANLSKIKREQLLSKIENLKKNLKDPNDIESLNTINEIQKEIQNKKYGLVWEEHSEKVDEMLVDNIPVFTEDKSKEIISDPSLPYNFLIEGDNLHALKLLEKTHKGKIDVIYIDPPYNRGKNDFCYDDQFISLEDGYRHSKWCSFMNKRLLIARELLADDGVIIVSIDEHEKNNLAFILDDIFGTQNNLGEIIWNKMNPKGDPKAISIMHETIYCYAKNREVLKNQTSMCVRKKINAPTIISKANSLYKKIGKEITPKEIIDVLKLYGFNEFKNNFKVKYDLRLIQKEFNNWLKGQNFTSGEKAYRFIDNNGKVFQDVSMCWPNKQMPSENYYVPLIHPITNKPCPVPDKGWRYPPSTMKAMLAKDLIIFGEDENKQPRQKYLLEENMYENVTSIYENGDSDDVLLKNLNIKFDYPKPLSMVLYVCQFIKPNAQIFLDFFAGSGTTGHAILKLNNEDEGNRKFILCTNNENKICENVTYQRLLKVINGYAYNTKSEVIHTERCIANLKYYKTEFIPKNCNQNQSNSQTIEPNSGINEVTLCDKLQDHIRELIQLETHHNIDDDYYKMVLDDTVLSNLITNINKYPNLKEVYISSTILLDSNQKQILLSKNIKISEIPDYYFSNELKENGELW